MVGEYWAIVFPSICIFTSWFVVKDWKNWRQYYPTILFVISVNFICSVLTYEHWLWHLHKALFMSNHVMRELWMNFFTLPPLILMYLSRYPYKSRWLIQAAYMALWSAILSLAEGVFVILKLITYHNGWNFWWTVLFWFTMFPVLRLHHTRPLLAWLVFILCAIFVIPYFHIPITQLK